MSIFRKIAEWSYTTNRTALDANALQKGGVPRYAKRTVKRIIHRKEIGVLRRLRLW